MQDIERALDDEFAKFQEELNERINSMNAAFERSRGTILSDEDAAELKKLYRSIVKALHLDMNPNVSEAQIALFHNAVRAYEMGDLDSRRIIAAMTMVPASPEDGVDGMKLLMKEKERLTALLRSIKESIEEIKNS